MYTCRQNKVLSIRLFVPLFSETPLYISTSDKSPFNVSLANNEYAYEPAFTLQTDTLSHRPYLKRKTIYFSYTLIHTYQITHVTFFFMGAEPGLDSPDALRPQLGLLCTA
jgi:hypothetical protein